MLEHDIFMPYLIIASCFRRIHVSLSPSLVAMFACVPSCDSLFSRGSATMGRVESILAVLGIDLEHIRDLK